MIEKLVSTFIVIGLLCTGCGGQEKSPIALSSPSASQSVPAKLEEEPKQSEFAENPFNFQAEEPGQSSLSTPEEEVPGPSPIKTPSVPGKVQGGASSENIQDVTEMKLKVEVGEQTFFATLEENAAVDALAELLRQGPLALQLHDYSRFEKVGPLGTDLPAEDRQTTTQAGDIVLYTGNQIVLFYGSNSWSYTRLGRIDDLTGWVEVLGSGDVTVRLSLAAPPWGQPPL